MTEWTSAEKKWLRAARKLLREKPEKIKIYTVDGEISACKLHVSSHDLCEAIAPRVAIYSGACITDIHDQYCNGN